MPYIKQERRDELDPKINALAEEISEDRAGELNYAITKLLLKTMPKEKYVIYNENLGVLEAVKLEQYRRAVAKYEDKKIEENGDVFQQ